MAQGIVTYRSGERRHREYVDVVARFGRDGLIEPVCVMWRDGRSFPVDEVLDAGQFGTALRGVQTARYLVRFGGHETDLYLERRAPVPAVSQPERLRWWVNARDVTKPGHRPGEDGERAAATRNHDTP